MSDTDLVEACLKNKRQAQKELYLRFSYLMKGVCLRYTKSEDDAEDLLQESFIKVFKNLDSYNDQGTLGGWIRVITVNTAIEHYRKQKSIEKHHGEFKLINQDESFDEILETIDLNYLMGKIQLLSEGYRIVFNLYAIEGFNHREIAEKLSISEGTSKSQFARAKKHLQDMLKEDGELILKQFKDAQ